MQLNIGSHKKLNITTLKEFNVIDNMSLIDRVKKNKRLASFINILKKTNYAYLLKLWYLQFRASSPYLVFLKIRFFTFSKENCLY